MNAKNSPAIQLNNQIKSISDDLDKIQDKQLLLIEQRDEISNISSSADDLQAFFKKVVNDRVEQYKTHHQRTINEILYSGEQTTRGLHDFFDILSKKSVRKAGVLYQQPDLDMLLFLLQEPILNNISQVVSKIIPNETMDLSKKKIKISEIDMQIEKLETEHNKIISEIEEDGFMKVDIIYQDVVDETKPKPTTIDANVEKATRIKEQAENPY